MDEKPFEWTLFNLALTEPGAIDYFVRNLPTEDVGLVHGNSGVNQFYIALCDFHYRTGCDPIDPTAFKSYLSSESDIELALGGPENVEAVINEVLKSEPSTPQAVVGLLKYRANRKRQKDLSEELQQLLDNDALTAAEQSRVGLLSAQIRTLSDEQTGSPMDRLVTTQDLAERAKHLWDLPDFLPTPYQKLNRALSYTSNGGVCKSAITAILAPSGKGKSTLAKCFVNHWLNEGFKVLFVNYEEAEKHWERILLTQLTETNAYMGETLSEATKERADAIYQSYMLKWEGRLFVLHDPETAYFEDLEALIRSIITQTDFRPDAIVIDTIQSMFMKSGAGKPRWGQYEEMMVRLEKLAKDTGAAIMLTAQENTNRMKERREVVMQSDAGGSISIVQKCSVTIHIVDKSLADNDDSINDRQVELQIPKNRITGSAFTGDPPVLEYNDATKSFQEPTDDGPHIYDVGGIHSATFKDGDLDIC